MKNCKNCNKQFNPISSLQLHCSDICRKKYKNKVAWKRKKLRLKTDPEYKEKEYAADREYQKRVYAENEDKRKQKAIRDKAIYDKNKEKILAKKKEYRNKEDVKNRIKSYRKAYYEFKKDDIKKNTSRNKKVIALGLMIKDVALQNPVYGIKSLWDGVGIWATDYYSCIKCNTTIYQHHAKGLCKRCYDREHHAKLDPNSKEYKAFQKKLRYMEQKDLINETNKVKRKQATVFINKALKQEIEVTPKISNLLDNLMQILDK